MRPGVSAWSCAAITVAAVVLVLAGCGAGEPGSGGGGQPFATTDLVDGTDVASPPGESVEQTPDPSATVAVGAAVEDYLNRLPSSPAVTSAGATVAVAVSGEGWSAQVNGDRIVPSASAAKAYWVDAAAQAVGVDAVRPYVDAVFRYSDNNAAGGVIGLVGADGINAATRSWGMSDTFLSSWRAGGEYVASDRPELGTYNVTTVADGLRFLETLTAAAEGGDEVAVQVLDWMTLAPDSLEDGTQPGAALVAQLPPSVAAATSHKAGWYWPGESSMVDSTVIALGVIPLPDRGTYLVAVSAVDGLPAEQLRLVGTISRDIHDIVRGSDAPAGYDQLPAP